ncbi:amidohydrolase family protein [Planctomycetota bacterium]
MKKYRSQITASPELSRRDHRSQLVEKAVSLAVIIVISLLPSPSSATEDVNKVTVIQNVRVFDGNQVIPQSTVLFRSGGVLDVNEGATIPEGAEVIDGEGKTLLPGLIDAHVHVWEEAQLRQFLVFGVTSVIDMGMDVAIMQRIKDLPLTVDCNDMATLVSAGTPVTAPGGHGTQFLPTMPTLSRPEEAQSFVDDRVAEGSDFIKVMVDDFSVYTTTPYRLPTLNKETLSAVFTAAHRDDRLAVVHIAKQQEARWVIEAGADGLAHLFSNDVFDPNFGTVLAQPTSFVIPTLSILESMSGASQAHSLLTDPYLSPYLKQQDINSLCFQFPVTTSVAGYQAAETAIQQLMDANVPILAGTDAANPGTAHGVSLHRELVLLVQAGLTPIEALTAATLNPAVTFDLHNRGQIKPGFHADLLLVNGNPTENIQATRDIVGVWKNGVRVDRESYRERIAAEQEGRGGRR